MKKLYLLPLIMAFAVACQTEEMPAPGQNETIEGELTEKVFTADFSAETKTVLDESRNVKWSSGDVVTIYGGAESAPADAVISDDGYSASLTVVLPETEVYYAVYPAIAAKGCTDGRLKLELPAKQTAVAGSFDKNAALAVARSEARNFSFKNVCGLLAFKVAEEGVTSVAISSLGDEPLAGAAEVVFAEDGTPEVTATDATAKTVTVSGTFERDKTYYAAVYSSACEKGISIAYTIGDKTYTYNLHKAGALPARSKVRTVSVGTLSAMSAATSFKVESTALVSDYDANVFAKNTALKGNLTDNNGKVILTVPFSAVRTVVNKETSTVDLYDAANDLQPSEPKKFFYGAESTGWYLERPLNDGTYYVNSMTGWDEWKGKPYSFSVSLADPQILMYYGDQIVIPVDANGNTRSQFCIKTGYSLEHGYTIITEGTGTGSPKEASATKFASKTLGFAPASGVDTPIEINKWMDMVVSISNKRWISTNRIILNKIVIDIRNNKILFE